MQVPFLLSFFVTLTFTSIELKAQSVIFPELTGEALIAALVAEYKTQHVLSLTQAKDTLYARIEVREDSVHGIYTDYTLFLPQGQDPSQALFMGGSGLNLEHSWPQSKGAGDGRQGQSDMHHLYPSRVVVNSARGSFPFEDIKDSDTEKWFYKSIELTEIPGTLLDLYSESSVGHFEPRESAKGDIARAMFYFYTMYKTDADNADPDFFEEQQATLCTWHYADPADENEMIRTQLISTYQDGKVNPFVLDCTLAERTYCLNGGECATVPVTQPELPDIIDIRLIQRGCSISLEVEINSPLKITNSIINSGGQLLYTSDTLLTEGRNNIDFDACDLPQGIYFLNSILRNGNGTTVKTLKFAITGQP